MRTTKTDRRVDWIIKHKTEIEKARSNDHSECRGKCQNGATCYNQSDGGYGWWANALDIAGIDPERCGFWTGSNPTPSTSINRGIARYIQINATSDIK